MALVPLADSQGSFSASRPWRNGNYDSVHNPDVEVEIRADGCLIWSSSIETYRVGRERVQLVHQ